MFKVGIKVLPREGLADPQSGTVKNTLRKLGFESVEECHVGRLITLDMLVNSKEEALSQAREMCEKLLTNPVMEDVQIEILKEL